MKRQFFPIVLWIEAVLLLLIVLLGGEATPWQAGLLSLPFAQIGAGLRALSLSGAIGNSIAVVLYLLLSLVPVGILVWRSRCRRLVPEDSLLVGLSLFLFVMFYVMINPGEIPLLLTGDGRGPGSPESRWTKSFRWQCLCHSFGLPGSAAAAAVPGS